jgi:hypothetical protein
MRQNWPLWLRGRRIAAGRPAGPGSPPAARRPPKRAATHKRPGRPVRDHWSAAPGGGATEKKFAVIFLLDGATQFVFDRRSTAPHFPALRLDRTPAGRTDELSAVCWRARAHSTKQSRDTCLSQDVPLPCKVDDYLFCFCLCDSPNF